jgi:bifunctional DNA-binding transcriptional regulator/antitoxin component of YhaV-PrlF toxin-antitoxin module
MSKVTTKLQVSVPKALADQYGIAPGDDLIWEPAGEALRVRLADRRAVHPLDGRGRLRLFDAATGRQAERQSRRKLDPPGTRGWVRDELYDQHARAR